MEKTKLFKRDFTMVVIGQIISLFGNGILRFALPLYLLKQNRQHSLAWLRHVHLYQWSYFLFLGVLLLTG